MIRRIWIVKEMNIPVARTLILNYWINIGHVDCVLVRLHYGLKWYRICLDHWVFTLFCSMHSSFVIYYWSHSSYEGYTTGYRMKWGVLDCCISNGVWKGDLRGRDSAVSAGTTLRIGRPRNTAKFFCASKRPGRLQGPLIPILSCYLGFLFWVKPTYLHLRPSFEWMELCFHTLSNNPSWRAQAQLLKKSGWPVWRSYSDVSRGRLTKM